MTEDNLTKARQYRQGFEAIIQKPMFKELYQKVLDKKAFKLKQENYKVNKLIKSGWVGESDREFLLFSKELNSLIYKLNKQTQKDREIIFMSILANTQK
jgi:hypothetical protein